MSSPVRPVILSGGAGTRLWPLSRAAMPKQFLPLVGRKSMFQLTLERIIGIGTYDAPVVVGSSDHEQEFRLQLTRAGVTEFMMILEPCARSTAAAVALAALCFSPNQVLLVMPSDHIINSEEAFHRAVQLGIPLAETNYLMTFGITPRGPETGFGYIKRGRPLTKSAFEITSFVEKPHLKAAAEYCLSDEYFWNSGIFLFRAGSYLDALASHAPEVFDACQRAHQFGVRQGSVLRPDTVSLEQAPTISVDEAIMERHDRIGLIPANIGWYDIGSWDALYDLLATKPGHNVADARAKLIDCTGCLIKSDSARVMAVEVDDLIVVVANDTVLILPRGRSQRVKELSTESDEKNHSENSITGAPAVR